MWLPLLKRYWDIALLRESPANTPCSFSLWFIAMGLYWLVLMLQWSLLASQSTTPIMPNRVGLTLLFSLMIYTYGLLFLNGKQSRFLQTATSLVMVHIITHIAVMPIILVSQNAGGVGGLNRFISMCLTLTISIWQFLAISRIYQLATLCRRSMSFLASFGLIIFNILMVSAWT